MTKRMNWNFNPRSREGSDNKSSFSFSGTEISIHAPAKGATKQAEQVRLQEKFQSTLPRRERRFQAVHVVVSFHISIHAPAKGATQIACTKMHIVRISIHAPAKGATLKDATCAAVQRFQSTLPRRERPRLPVQKCTSSGFQSTLPRRERRLRMPPAPPCKDFNPRSREGSDNMYKMVLYDVFNFNPRSREGSDGAYRPYKRRNSRFQSTLPRRERRDVLKAISKDVLFQSTLPRRERHSL